MSTYEFQMLLHIHKYVLLKKMQLTEKNRAVPLKTDPPLCFFKLYVIIYVRYICKYKMIKYKLYIIYKGW